MTFEETLADWLPSQRWFAGKGARLDGIAIQSDTPLAEGDPGMRHLIVSVSQDGRPVSYQLLVGLRAQVPERLAHVVIGTWDEGRTAYDALHDSELTRVLLGAMARQEALGPLEFGSEPDSAIDPSVDSLVLTGEQSNTSLLFGEDSILKVFRRLSPGPNPDLEVPQALARMGSEHVARPLGWIETRSHGELTVLGILSAYLRAATDGWTLAATSVRDLYAADAPSPAEAGGDFAPEAERLGAATAVVHRDLARAFGTDELPPGSAAEVADQMLGRLDEALAAVPALGRYAGLLSAAFTDLGKLEGPLPVQRVHGDYHLGQVMRTQTGWVLIDFEGEPARPLAERRARHPALRDVAGMLRSFEYAARHQLTPEYETPVLRQAAREWAHRNQAAFCAGYAGAGGADPHEHAILLRALTFDKAVYEVVYEARHRPSWLHIPLESLDDA
jgi:maltokinase